MRAFDDNVCASRVVFVLCACVLLCAALTMHSTRGERAEQCARCSSDGGARMQRRAREAARRRTQPAANDAPLLRPLIFAACIVCVAHNYCERHAARFELQNVSLYARCNRRTPDFEFALPQTAVCSVKAAEFAAAFPQKLIFPTYSNVKRANALPRAYAALAMHTMNICLFEISS